MFKFVPLTTLVVAAALVQPATAALKKNECPEKDFSARLGPPRNQGPQGLCYAYVAADLLTFHNGFLGGRRISSKDVALNYLVTDENGIEIASREVINSGIKENFTQSMILTQKKKLHNFDGLAYQDRIGGSVSGAAIAYFNRGGYCTESKLESDQSEHLNFLGSVSPHLSQLIARPRRTDAAKAFRELTGLPCPDSKVPWLNSFGEYRGQLNNEVVRMMDRHANQECAPRPALKPYEVHSAKFTPGEHSSVLGLITGILRLGRPVGVDVNGQFLIDGNTSVPSELNHAASIVGARWNKRLKRCEFKFRNSWGTSCSAYDAHHQPNCEDGNIWLSETDVKNNVFTTHVVYPK